jgi:hypothetical protein
VPRRTYSEERVESAIDALRDPDRFREAEAMVTNAAPKLQSVLAEAMQAGGWFGEAHEAEVLKAATVPDSDQRVSAVRTLLAEEARMGMLVGVAVGWALADELAEAETDPAAAEAKPSTRPENETDPAAAEAKPSTRPEMKED